ncbi:N-acetylglucosamine-specific PTS transporter subunit IIBC [Culicoidibacter larvae]|uniref:PTS sugar transporter n=1 Tax=Culicoidibacter larvae TaxID=2579976 RepID=A0A5R8QFM6_9FIRM|nr:N-acetylglucosamine-specific PTS transporter subunit IIBC [Culicoidibacter larvae]TLG76560.1 PTS sugar transporter [Culicoidibacter larvae]
MLKYLQRIGKSLMLPVAALPAAAILLRIGAADVLDIPFISLAGGAIMDHMAALFAISIAFGMSKDNHGAAALAGLIGFYVVIGVLAPAAVESYGVTDEMALAAFGKVSNNVLIGVLVGIIASVTYNRFSETKLPAWIGFFSGRRLVPILTSIFSLILAAILFFVWPFVWTGISAFGDWLISLGAIGAGLFGFFNRLLIPLGLHHVLNSIFWFNFGEFIPTVGAGAGVPVYGDIFRFLAGDPTAGIYQAGFFPVMMFGLPGAGFAMAATAKKENRKEILSAVISVAAVAFLTGITEPIEFLFMFAAPVLYVIHAALTGLSLFLANIFGFLHGFGFSAGLFDYVLNFGLATNPIGLLIMGVAFFFVYFFIFYFVIKAFNLKTPGREDDFETNEQEIDDTIAVESSKAARILEGLGGKDNIVTIDNCSTRLRLDVKDADIIDEKKIKSAGAAGVMKTSKTAAQVIIGVDVQFVADDIKKLMKETKTKEE